MVSSAACACGPLIRECSSRKDAPHFDRRIGHDLHFQLTGRCVKSRFGTSASASRKISLRLESVLAYPIPQVPTELGANDCKGLDPEKAAVLRLILSVRFS